MTPDLSHSFSHLLVTTVWQTQRRLEWLEREEAGGLSRSNGLNAKEGLESEGGILVGPVR